MDPGARECFTIERSTALLNNKLAAIGKRGRNEIPSRDKRTKNDLSPWKEGNADYSSLLVL